MGIRGERKKGRYLNLEIHDGLQNNEEEIRSFLLIGQSNMAGRGDFGEVDPIDNRSCFMLRMGRWQPMSEPINPDRSVLDGKFHSGICLGASFADEAARAWKTKIGLIPCADGGTRIDQWQKGEVLFDHAVMMARLAMRTSKLSGILWHQGEGDSRTDNLVAAYKPKLIAMMTLLRRELGAEELPLILGELSDQTGAEWGIAPRVPKINAIIHEVASELPMCAVVSSKGLTLKADGLHFDSKSLRIFGKRYFEACEELLLNRK